VCQVMWKLISEYTLFDIIAKAPDKDVETPFFYFAFLFHVLKDVAICPSGKPRGRG